MPRPFAPPGRLFVAMALLLIPGEASGRSAPHIALLHSDPVDSARLRAPPGRISLWFTGRPRLPFSRIQLVGPDGEVPLSAVAADTGNTLYADVPFALPAGAYRVRWQTASADGHVLRGEIPFQVLGPVDAVGAADSSTRIAFPPGAPASAMHTDEYRSARWIEFVALVTVLGVLGFRHGVLPPLALRGVPTADAADRARRLGMTVLIPYAGAALVRLYTEARAIHGADLRLASVDVGGLLTGTIWGIGWASGAAGALLLLAGWRASTRSVTIGTPLALTGAMGMVLSPALSGHAAASPHFVLSVTLDMLHVSAAGLWVGGLLLVLVAGIPAMRRLTEGNSDAAVSALVNSFHPLALFCAPLVVAAGLGTSWIRLGGFGEIVETPYGRTLLLKTALVLVVAAVGGYNAIRARRALGTPDATRRFRWSASAELLVAALVLAATTVLVATPPPESIGSP